MTDKNFEHKTPESLANAIKRSKSNRQRQPISVDLFLVKDEEKEAFEIWQNLKSKKEFLMFCLKNSDRITKELEQEKKKLAD